MARCGAGPETAWVTLGPWAAPGVWVCRGLEPGREVVVLTLGPGVAAAGLEVPPVAPSPWAVGAEAAAAAVDADPVTSRLAPAPPSA